MCRLANKIGMNETIGHSVRHHIVGKADRNEIDYNESMHTKGVQSSLYIGVSLEGHELAR